jgi:hypothetical protein
MLSRLAKLAELDGGTYWLVEGSKLDECGGVARSLYKSTFFLYSFNKSSAPLNLQETLVGFGARQLGQFLFVPTCFQRERQFLQQIE